MPVLEDIFNCTRDWHKCYASTRDPKEYSVLNVWLDENMQDQYFILGGLPIEVRFKSEEDVILFNLRWA